MVDEGKLHQFIGQMLGDLGGAASISMVRIGDALGLYKALHAKGSMTCAELAQEVGVNQRYLREWLSHQAASNYLSYEPASGKFTLPPEQAMVFADRGQPGLHDGRLRSDGITDRCAAQGAGRHSRPVGGVPGTITAGCMFCAVARFFRPGYHNNLVANWLPALDGVVEKLQRGAQRGRCRLRPWLVHGADGEGVPELEVRRLRLPSELDRARRARTPRSTACLANTRFEVAKAKEFPGTGFDLVTFFDCLHDMGDPAGAAAHVRQSLKPDGTWMIVEPMAGDRLEDNLNPVGRLYYAGSTMVCVPTSLSQEVGAALGAQAGEAQTARGDHRRRLPQRAARDGNAVQHDPGGAAVA